MVSVLRVNTSHSFKQRIFGFGMAMAVAMTAKSAAADEFPLPSSADWGASTYQMAGAAAASTLTMDAFLTNPAGLAHYTGQAAAGASYIRAPRGAWQAAAGLVDGTQFGLVGGFHMAWTDFGRPRRQSYTAGVAYKTPYGLVGTTGHVYYYQKATPGKGWYFSNSLGVITAPVYGLSLGAYAKHLLDGHSASRLPPSVHLGAVYTYEQQFRAMFDAFRKIQISGQDWNYSAAGDLLLQEFFLVRGGYHWNHSREDSFWTVGGGVLSPRFNITGSFMRTTSGSASNGFTVDAQMKF